MSGPPGIWIPPGIGLGAGSTRGSPWACATPVMVGSSGPAVAAAPAEAPYLKSCRRLSLPVGRCAVVSAPVAPSLPFPAGEVGDQASEQGPPTASPASRHSR
jgi:hypothetical protein